MTTWWHDRRWRLIQTNLREIDMLDISSEQVVADLQAFKANVLMLNAAGIIASYPTKLPFQFQSPYLQHDSLQDILNACHAAGIRVIARTDFSKIRRPIYEAHPDWAYISPQGEIVDYNGDVHVCINGPYQQEYALRIIEELLDTHDFDGIFFNMGGYQTRDYSGNYYGICHCEHCQQLFRQMFGLDLPGEEDLSDPAYRKYTLFRQRTLRAHGKRVHRFITERWPNVCIANHAEFGSGFIRQESNTAIGRPLPYWQYSASDNTKGAVTSYPDSVPSNTTVDFIDYPYRHVAVSPHQQALRLAQNLANGGALDYYLCGRLDNHEDRSGFAAIKDIFHYHAAHEKDYVNMRSRADVLLLKPPRGLDAGEYRGWFRVLVENHFLFDAVRYAAALNVSLDRYRAIVVPGLETLGDAPAARLDDFVADGGVLIGVGQSGFLDEGFEPRVEPALKSLGIDKVLYVREDMQSSYFTFTDKVGFARFTDTDLVYMYGPYVYAQYADMAEQRMQLIPPHHFGPPERCYYELVTDHPGLVVHPFGKGKAVYLPWSPGELFHRQGHLNTADFCADLLEGIAGLKPVDGNLSPMVEVTLFEHLDGNTQLLHLVNSSGHFGNSFYTPVPMENVRVTVPCAREPEAVTGLRTAQVYEHTWDKGQLTLHVPRLGLFEAVKVDLA